MPCARGHYPLITISFSWYHYYCSQPSILNGRRRYSRRSIPESRLVEQMGSTNANTGCQTQNKTAICLNVMAYPLTEAAIATGSCIDGIFWSNNLPVLCHRHEVRERTKGLGIVFHVSVDNFLRVWHESFDITTCREHDIIWLLLLMSDVHCVSGSLIHNLILSSGKLFMTRV